MFNKLICSACIILVAVSVAVAQGPGRPGRGGPGRFGFGPPGFGPGGFGPGGAVMQASNQAILSLPEVRTELKLTDSQKTDIDQAIGKVQDSIRDAMSDLRPDELFNLNEDERQKRMDTVRQQTEKVVQESDPVLEKLLSPDQAGRLRELRLQREGAAALLRADIARQLELTSDQQSKLKEIQSKTAVPFGPGMRGPGGPPDFARIEQERKKADETLLAELSDSQKSKWTSLLGKSFDFPAPRMGGPGGPGGMMGPERKLLSRFDQDSDHVLNRSERKTAREELKKEGPANGRGFGPFGGGPPGPGGRPGNRERSEPPRPGKRINTDEAVKFTDSKLYDIHVLRTLFLEFENDDWETELSDFHRSDIEVPAKLTVDGVAYPNVGVHFRGMSSYGMVPAGYKRSLNISLDLVDDKQRLYGYKTLNLLNCHEDPSCMSTVLYSQIARKYMPAPQANFVNVVINGEYWGVYANVQQFNKEFLAENFKTTGGHRWKVRGSPGGGGGLDYQGEDIEAYRRRYEIKTKDTDKAWRDLIKLCKTLSETPADKLPAAIEPMLDVDQLLWFLALDVALINNDGYWVRASDYSIYEDEAHKFHIVPHDMNEAFHPAMMMGFGPGGGRGPGGPGPNGPNGPGRGARRPNGDGPPGQPADAGPNRGERPPRGGAGVQLDPLIGLDDDSKPLRSKILAVPAYRTRYLQHVRTIAEESLNWETLGPLVAELRELIEDDVYSDTRKLESFEAFERVTGDRPDSGSVRGREFPLRLFADQRREFLLNVPAIREVSN